MARKKGSNGSIRAQDKRATKRAFSGTIDKYFDKVERAREKISDKADNVRKYRKEASRLSAIANKRIARLEKNNLTDSPAYQKYIAEGGQKFGVKGKDYNQVQAEMARLRQFINSETSTIKGINKNLKEMAKNTGIKYNNLKELKQKASKFFELSSKVEQYLRTVDDMASAIGYQKIWEAVNQYVETNEGALDSGEDNIDSMVKAVTDAIKNYESPTQLPGGGSYKLIDTPSNRK